MINEFVVFVLYEWAGAHDVRRFFVGVSVGGAEHSLAGPFRKQRPATGSRCKRLSVRRWRARSNAVTPITTAEIIFDGKKEPRRCKAGFEVGGNAGHRGERMPHRGIISRLRTVRL